MKFRKFRSQYLQYLQNYLEIFICHFVAFQKMCFMHKLIVASIHCSFSIECNTFEGRTSLPKQFLEKFIFLSEQCIIVIYLS